MNRNKKVVESMTVASALIVMSTITALGGSTEDSIGSVTGSVTLGGNGTAGVIMELNDIELVPLSNNVVANVEKVQKDTALESGEESDAAQEPATESVVAVAGVTECAAEAMAQGVMEAQEEYFSAESLPDTAEAAEIPEEVEVQELAANTEADVPAEVLEEQAVLEEVAEKAAQESGSEEDTAWSNMVMANVEEDMNIRMEPNAESELAGKFYRGDVAEVISVEGEWTQISSGNATGYVKNEYLVYGEEASQLANEVCSLYATVNTDGLRLRSEPSEEADIVTTASSGDRLKVNKEAEETDGWVAVNTSDSIAYVSAEYVNVELNLGTALNSEEVAAKEAQKAAEERAAADASKKSAVSASSDDVTLLGALIQCEAGGGSYEGMVAVGAVVMNRVRSGSYPGSISGVIYQGGQFPPALNGSVANVMANGVRSACLQAAREAISGVDNTNGALSFRSASSGSGGTLIGANVFF